MEIDKRPPTKILVRQLFELACTPFTLPAFRRQWSSYGWSWEPASGDEFGFQVQVPDAWPLSVDPLGEEIIGAMLPFCYWEDYDVYDEWEDDDDQELHADPEEYARQRAAYDAEFEAAVQLAQQTLPPPWTYWTDMDRDAHRAVVWEGEHGLLILQQAAFDVQFGIEINFWLEGCSKEEFRPTTPLIDWLCKRRQQLHDERDFPPLPG